MNGGAFCGTVVVVAVVVLVMKSDFGAVGKTHEAAYSHKISLPFYVNHNALYCILYYTRPMVVVLHDDVGISWRCHQ